MVWLERWPPPAADLAFVRVAICLKAATTNVQLREGVLGSAPLRNESDCGHRSARNRESTFMSVCKRGVALLGEMSPLPLFLCALDHSFHDVSLRVTLNRYHEEATKTN